MSVFAVPFLLFIPLVFWIERLSKQYASLEERDCLLVTLAFATTALMGCSGDSAVPPTTDIITGRRGSARMPVLYDFALVGRQIGAFLGSCLGGVDRASGVAQAA